MCFWMSHLPNCVIWSWFFFPSVFCDFGNPHLWPPLFSCTSSLFQYFYEVKVKFMCRSLLSFLDVIQFLVKNWDQVVFPQAMLKKCQNAANRRSWQKMKESFYCWLKLVLYPSLSSLQSQKGLTFYITMWVGPWEWVFLTLSTTFLVVFINKGGGLQRIFHTWANKLVIGLFWMYFL